MPQTWFFVGNQSKMSIKLPAIFQWIICLVEAASQLQLDINGSNSVLTVVGVTLLPQWIRWCCMLVFSGFDLIYNQ